MISPFSQSHVFFVYTEMILVLFSKTCTLKSLHFQAPKTQLTLIVFLLHAALDDHESTYSISINTDLLTEPTLGTRFVGSQDITLFVLTYVIGLYDSVWSTC